MFKEFKVKDIFELVGGKQPAKKDRFENLADDLVPAITGVTVNNGTGFYTTKEGKKIYSNILTISKDGEYAGTVYLQDREVYLAGHSMGLIPKIEIDNNCLIYIASLFINYLKIGYWKINAQIPSVTNTKMNDVVISLPVIENANPDHEYTVDDIDWQYMRDYITELERDRITELERERITELDAYLQATGLNDYELTEDDKKILSLSTKRASDEDGTLEDNSKDEVRFGKFKATDLFDIKKGKRLTKADMIKGNINFVGSSASNNGITAKIGNKEYLHPAHTFTVSYNGSVGEVFLQDEPFWASDDVNVWYPKFPYNQCVIEYIMSVVRRLKDKYSYAAKWTLDKMQAEILELPIKSDGTPDFDYMERYIRIMEKVVIADVVKYKDKVIEETRKVVGA